MTKPDFYNEETRRNLFSTLSELISLNIIPIINTNDAVTPPPQIDEEVVKGSVKVSKSSRAFLLKYSTLKQNLLIKFLKLTKPVKAQW